MRFNLVVAAGDGQALTVDRFPALPGTSMCFERGEQDGGGNFHREAKVTKNATPDLLPASAVSGRSSRAIR